MPERYTLSSVEGLEVAPRYNIARGQEAPIADAAGVRLARWGLLAPWRGHGGKRAPNVYEAPIAAIAATPVLRDALRKRRCLVLADGFFAWRKLARMSQPYWLHTVPVRRIAFAGLCATHRDDDRPSFAIVVAPAAGAAAQLGDTMPVVVGDDWLASAEDAERALAAPSLDGWRADAVSTHVNAEGHDDPQCIALLGNPAQGELF
jgi:putative SOS response-associated peptidase YedK